MSQNLDRIKNIADKLRKNLSKRQREAVADYLKSFITSEESSDIEESLDTLDRDYLAMQRDEEALRKRNEAVKALAAIGKEALLLALKL